MGRYKRVVVKIGSNVLAAGDGSLDIRRMEILVGQIAALVADGVEVIVISSGAVASGRSELGDRVGRLDSVSARQLYSAVGQAKLINRYFDLFAEKGLACGQVLTTKASLATRLHYLNQRNCVSVMLENNVIPILNENDAISVTELMFTDNDELSGLVSTMMDADALIILSNVDGIYNGHPAQPGSEVIRKVGRGGNVDSYIQAERSQFGRGGMLTKSRIALKVADEGIEVIIANGKKDTILTDLVLNGADVVCTRFEPSPNPISGIRKWIAHSDGFANGAIRINEGAEQALTSQRATSLLPVGVEEIEGDFEKDDIVGILSHDGRQLGVGKVSADSVRARALIGRKGARPLIHYDYLHLD